MIITKKIWLRWPDEDFFDGIAVPYENDDSPEWVSEEPRRHNGIIEKGTELVLSKNQGMLEPKGEYVLFNEVNKEELCGHGFTMEELFKFIKDGTFQLKDGK